MPEKRMPARSKLTKRADGFRRAVRANGGKWGIARPTKKRTKTTSSGSKVIREGISGMSVDASGKVTNAGKKFFKFRTK